MVCRVQHGTGAQGMRIGGVGLRRSHRQRHAQANSPGRACSGCHAAWNPPHCTLIHWRNIYQRKLGTVPGFEVRNRDYV